MAGEGSHSEEAQRGSRHRNSNEGIVGRGGRAKERSPEKGVSSWKPPDRHHNRLLLACLIPEGQEVRARISWG